MKIRINKSETEYCHLEYREPWGFQIEIYNGYPEDTITAEELEWKDVIKGLEYHGFPISDGYLENID